MAILPAPVWASVPSTTPFTVTSGAATWSAAGTTGTINITADRSILTWGNTAQTDLTTVTNFNIAAGETFNFVQPAGGAVLNKVSAGTNTTASVFNGLGAAAAAINGSLISNGRVIVLSTSGNIIVGGGAQITTGGLVLSTLAESSDFNFTAQGNLALSNTSASNGSIFLGTGTSAVNAVGNLAAYSGAVTTNNLSVTGDLILNQNGLSALALTTANPTTVTGNFSATTNNTAITKGNGLLTVSGNGSLKSGTGDITLTGNVASLSVTAGGAGYTAVPSVTLSGGSGSGSTASVSTVNVSSAAVTTNGTGYTNAATVSVTFSAPPVGGTLATGTATVNTTSGQVTGISITNAGSGYTAVPTITISDTGTGTGAVASSRLAITGLSVTANGTGFVANPTVSIPGGTTNATATAALQGGASFGGTLTINSSGNVTVAAGGNLAVGASTAGNLTLSAAGDVSTTAAVAVNATANLISRNSGNVTFANGSTAANLTASAVGSATVNTTSNVTFGNITAGAGADVTIAAGAATLDGTILAGNNVTITANSLNSTANGIIGSSSAFARSVSVNGTGAGSNVVLPGISTRTLNVQTNGGSVSQFGTGVTNPITVTGNAAVPGAVTINAGTAGSITLNANNSFNGTTSTVNLTGNNISLNASTGVTFGSLNAAGSVTVNTSTSAFGSGAVTFGVGGGTTPSNITIGGSLAVSTNGSNVGDDPQANENIFGSITVNTIAAGFGQLANNATVSGGTGYLSAPRVVLSGGGGSGAVATSTINTTTGTVSAINITNGGTGYNSPAAVTIFGGGNNTVDNVGTTTLVSGSVAFTATDLANVDKTGFVSTPTVTLTAAPSGGTNATATASVDTTTGTLLAINITNPGAGYTAAPTLTIVGGTANNTSVPTIGTVAVIPKGDVTFTAQANQGSGTYGQFTVTAAGVNIAERTTLNVGAITGTGITLRSTGADILINGQQTINNGGDISLRANSGNITQVSGAIVGASGTTLTANINGGSGNVTLNNTSNAFGTLSYNATSANTTANIVSTLSVTAAQLAAGTSNIALSTVNPGTNITISAGGFNGTATFNAAGSVFLTSNNSTNSLNARNLILIAGDVGANSISQNGVNQTTSATSNTAYQGLNVNGTLTISTPGGVTLTNNNNPSLGNVVLSNVTGATSVISMNTTGNISNVSGIAAGTVNLTSGTVGQNSVPMASTITLGNLIVGNLNARANNGGTGTEGNDLLSNGASGDIKQATGSSLHVENVLTAVTFNGGNIVLGNAGNSAGRVQLSTAGALPAAGVFTQALAGSSGNITYTEDSTVKLGALQTTGNATINSRFGGIIEDPAANDTFNVGALILSAPAGSISLGNNTHTAGITVSNITTMNATAAGSAVLFSNYDLVLGNVAANSLNVTANSIAQSAPLNIFGLSSFTATLGGITLTNAANNFGPISVNVNAANQNVAITENSTLNLRSVTTVTPSNGTFTATSVNGDIIDTGLGGVRLGGSIVGGVSTSGSGVVTLTATNGNIVINDPTSDILTSAGVVFNAKDVTLSVFGSPTSTLVLGANSASSVARGNLVASSGLGNIGNNGAFSVGGVASIQTGNGNITIDKPNVGFGTLQFSGNQVIIREAGNMDILAGSSAFGQAQLASGGDITIVPGAGSVTFGNSVAFQATGNITLRQMQAVGTVLLSHTGTANLSALSNSTDLNGRWTNANDLGTGPGPNTDATLAPKP